MACGKSTVAAWLPDWGGDVLDTDDVTHRLEAPGGEAVAPLVEAFGEGVRDRLGGIDRRRLASQVFADDAARERLNAILHPRVRQAVEAWLARPPATGVRFRAVVVPLLFEVGWRTPRWDAVVAVVCRPEEQWRRLLARGMTPQEAQARLAAQLSCEEKARRADYVLHNDGDRETLRQTAQAVVNAVLEKVP